MRGYSLEQDLKSLINNPKYCDVELLCEDEKKLYGCKAILAARSEVFDRLFYNGMKESYEKQISFPNINSSGMEIVLEYIYTGSIKEGSLTKDNIIETFQAADYFQLLDLQNFVMNTIKRALEKSPTENFSPELLSKVTEIMPLTDDNALINLLVETIAMIPLNTIEFGRLSITGLQYLLSCTYEKEKLFITPEYEVFRYSALLAAKQVSDDACKSLAERLPVIENLVIVGNKFTTITNHQIVAEELEPLVKFINFGRINGQILTDMIEPLEIISSEIMYSIYRNLVKVNNSSLNNIRGTLPFYSWDESACGSKLNIEDNGRVVQAPSNCGHQNVRAKMIFEKGVFEWDIIIEKYCSQSWIGVCASENFNCELWAGQQSTGWVLGSGGYCSNSNKNVNNYCPSFGEGTVITVYLDMNKRSLAFAVNGKKCPEISEWNNLPSKLHPVVSLGYSGRFRIQPHRKQNEF